MSITTVNEGVYSNWWMTYIKNLKIRCKSEHRCTKISSGTYARI